MVEIKTNRDDPFNYNRFEKARIIGARALQIAMGAPIIIADVPEEFPDPVRIAELEYNEGLVPITVHRPDVDQWTRREV